MAEWVYIENNEIKEYHGALPKSWRHISGLNKADDAFLLSQGWYRVEKNHELFDETTYEAVGREYQILTDRVVETLKLRAITEEEINKRNQEKKDSFFNFLRSQRNKLLSESDWTQVIDIQNTKPDDWIEIWKAYRQDLRDLPSQYENTENYDIGNIVWPNKPGA